MCVRQDQKDGSLRPLHFNEQLKSSNAGSEQGWCWRGSGCITASVAVSPCWTPAADLCLVGRETQGAGAGLLRGAVGKGCRKAGFVLVSLLTE